MVSLAPLELVGDLLPAHEAVARGLPFGVDPGVDLGVVEDLVEVDLRIGGELADPVLGTVVLVDAAEPGLRRGGDQAGRRLHPSGVRPRGSRPAGHQIRSQPQSGARISLHV